MQKQGRTQDSDLSGIESRAFPCQDREPDPMLWFCITGLSAEISDADPAKAHLPVLGSEVINQGMEGQSVASQAC